MIDFERVRLRHPLADYCAARGIELHRNGPNLVGLCPLHEESGPSFTVYGDNHFHCYGCGAHGDITDLEKALGGGTMLDAIERLGGHTKSATPIARKAAPQRSSYLLTDKDRALIKEACTRLELAPELALRVRPSLPLEAVRRAASQNHLGYRHDLAFARGIHGPAILFVYANGIKARWSRKVIRWLVGGPHGQCWRQGLLGPAHQRVYITEGETDALAMLSIRGFEDSRESMVVALPSASTLPAPEPFRGREIVLIPDNDEAGWGCAVKLARLLKPIAKAIRVVRFRG